MSTQRNKSSNKSAGKMMRSTFHVNAVEDLSQFVGVNLEFDVVACSPCKHTLRPFLFLSILIPQRLQRYTQSTKVKPKSL